MKFQMKQGVGKHTMTLAGKDIILKPGDTVDCTAEQLGGAIDKFEQIDSEISPKSQFKIVSRAPGFYDVIHPITGAAINTKALRKADAEALAGQTVEEYDAKVAKEAAEAEEAAKQAAAGDGSSAGQQGAGDGEGPNAG